MTPIMLPTAAERSDLLAVKQVRLRNLERLYERRALVDVLIRCLEEYQRTDHHACPLGFTVGPRLSSGFALSQI
jgi:hypothetical protein